MRDSSQDESKILELHAHLSSHHELDGRWGIWREAGRCPGELLGRVEGERNTKLKDSKNRITVQGSS